MSPATRVTTLIFDHAHPKFFLIFYIFLNLLLIDWNLPFRKTLHIVGFIHFSSATYPFHNLFHHNIQILRGYHNSWQRKHWERNWNK